jgi:hypothetical protein
MLYGVRARSSRDIGGSGMNNYDNRSEWKKTPDLDGEPHKPKMDPLGPSGRIPDAMQAEQAPLDIVDEAGMESFPCSDPPCYSRSHA